MDTKPHHRENGELQEDILRQLSAKNLTQKDLVESLGYNQYSAVTKAVKSLKKNNCIQVIGVTEPRGKKSARVEILGLTEVGVKQIMTKLKILDFWNMMFFFSDSKLKHGKLKLDFDEIFNEYESTVLKISKERFVPPSFLKDLDEFRSISLGKHDSMSNNKQFIAILDILSWNYPLSLSEMYSLLKLHYPDIYAHFMCIKCKKENPEFHSIMHKNRDLLVMTLDMMRNVRLISESEKNQKRRYHLTHQGLLRILYHQYHDLDQNTYKTLDLEKIQGNFDVNNIDEAQRTLLEKIPKIIKNQSHLLMPILSDESRITLGISDYEILYLLGIIYFENHDDFLFANVFENFKYLFTCQQWIEKRTNTSLRDYYESGIKALEGLFDNRKTKHNFSSELSEEFFLKIEKFHKEIHDKNAKETERQYRKYEEFKGTKYHSLYVKFVNRKYPEFQISTEDYINDLLYFTDWIEDLRNKKIPKNHIKDVLDMLPNEADRKIIHRLRPPLKKLATVRTKSKPFGHGRIAYDFDYFYGDYDQRVVDKITFDFLLLYSNLEPNRWNDEYQSQLPIRKWFDDKKRTLIELVNTYNTQLLN